CSFAHSIARRSPLFPYTTRFRSVWRPVRPLAASLQMLDQTVPSISINLAVGARGIPERKVVPPALHLSIQLSNQARDWLETLMTDRKSTRLNSSHQINSYVVFCL